MSRVVVIGGGLAGMVVAHELAKQNVPVVLLEAGEQLGGKASARCITLPKSSTTVPEDHGYHIVPAWYVNFRRLLKDLRLSHHLVDFHKIHYLKRGAFPRFNELHEPTRRNLLRNVFRFGLVRWPVQFLSFYAMLDLAGQPFKKTAMLDRISVTGFLRSRWYRTEEVADLQNQHILQASSIPSYQLCAMTAKRVLGSYFKCASPFHSVLDDDLQSALIEPFHQRLVQLGVDIRLKHRITKLEIDQDRVVKLVLDGQKFDSVSDDLFVATIPPDIVYEWVDADMISAEDRNKTNDEDEKCLEDLVHLELAPMASMHLYLNRKLPGIPREHVVLYKSRYQLSFIDISQNWKSLQDRNRTVLSGIASAYAPLKGISKATAITFLMKDLEDYIKIDKNDIAHVEVQPNVSRQLFLNTIGSWPFRPNTKTRLTNLYIAGDYCRSQAELTTMEGCVQSAMSTAGHILFKLGRTQKDQVKPIPIPTPIRPWLRVMFWVSAPLALLCCLLTWLTAKSDSMLRKPQPKEPRILARTR